MRALLFCFLLVAASLGLNRVRAPAPSGKYCGSFQNIVQINVTILTPSVAELNATVFGSETVSCPKEAVAYSSKTNLVTFPNINSPSDCLGSMLDEFGVDPSVLTVKYLPSQDQLDIAVTSPPASLVLKKCK